MDFQSIFRQNIPKVQDKTRTPQQQALYNANKKAQQEIISRDPVKRTKANAFKIVPWCQEHNNANKISQNYGLTKLKLIEAVKKYPILYNKYLPEYEKEVPTLEAWEMVAKETQSAVRQCRLMWKLVINQHTKTIKRKKPASVPYYLEEHLQFLNPFIIKKERPSVYEDHRKQFLISLLPDVRLLSYRQLKLFKCKALQLVDEALMENQNTLR